MVKALLMDGQCGQHAVGDAEACASIAQESCHTIINANISVLQTANIGKFWVQYEV
jgi:hypothetical protein